jgi:hypothetical protein
MLRPLGKQASLNDCSRDASLPELQSYWPIAADNCHSATASAEKLGPQMV